MSQFIAHRHFFPPRHCHEIEEEPRSVLDQWSVYGSNAWMPSSLNQWCQRGQQKINLKNRQKPEYIKWQSKELYIYTIHIYILYIYIYYTHIYIYLYIYILQFILLTYVNN
jgi:hypothetical protein